MLIKRSSEHLEKRKSHLEKKGSLLEKWVTLEKMGQTWKKGSQTLIKREEEKQYRTWKTSIINGKKGHTCKNG